ncbi:sialidase family protein [Lysobacter sp. A421]
MKPTRLDVLTTAVLATAILCGACSPVPDADTAAVDSAAVGDGALDVPPSAIATEYQRHPWPLPAPVGAAQPDLVAALDGTLLLSWIEPRQAGSHALGFSIAETSGGNDVAGWTAPATIATGDDWFVNWADTPHIAMGNDGALWAHWLQKSAAAGYAYDIALVRSDDGGGTWSAPVLVNDDGTATEHGFVSLWPQGEAGLGVAWLDGRQTAGGGHDAGAGHDGHSSQAGAMSLRAAQFDAAQFDGMAADKVLLRKSADTRIDAMTCDCCQTAIAVTSKGPLLAYRDRSAGEIRDIAVTRWQDNNWTPPHIVHPDQWEMPACPVNGPSIAANGDQVVIGWYTSQSTPAGEIPTVKLAYSDDAGDTFAAPITLDQGQAVQGRIAVAMDADSAWVVWLREDAQGQSLQLARYSAGLAREEQRIELAKVAGRGRGTGFPQIALAGGDAHVVWTEVVDGTPSVRGAVMQSQVAQNGPLH